MVNQRNLLIHGYVDIDYESVWQTVHEDVPELLQLIEAIAPVPPALASEE
jgi:uncharacterized protein with HEPN domain